MNEFLLLLGTLCLTIIIEYPIVQILWLAIKENEKSKLTFCNNKIILLPAIIVNVLTNPALNIFVRYWLREMNISVGNFWLIITLLEFIIWAIEGILYKYMLNTKWAKAFLLSITANLVSYLTGFLITP